MTIYVQNFGRERPGSNRAFPITFAAGFSFELDRYAGEQSANVALQHWRALYPLHGRPCHDTRPQSDELSLHFRDVRLPSCALLLPFHAPQWPQPYPQNHPKNEKFLP